MQLVTLDGLVGGYNGYTSPDLLSPQFWAAASNVYAGQFGTIRRARWAPVFNSTATGFAANSKRIVSMFSFTDILNNVTWEMFENNDIAATGPRWLIQYPLAAYATTYFGTSQAAPLLSIYTFLNNVGGQLAFPLSLSLLNGPYSRQMLNNVIFEANGLFRSKVLVGISHTGGNQPFFEIWGIDAPDVSPGVTISSGSTATISAAPTGAVRANNIATITTTAPHGLSNNQYVQISGVTDTTFNTAAGVSVQITVTGASTFTYFNQGVATTSGSGTATNGITKTVGRSYSYAWENANTGHVSAPSPASQYVKYTGNQVGTIDLVEPGTVSVGAGSTAVTGVGTSFSSAWVGKLLWAETLIGGSGEAAFIASVSSATTMTLSAPYQFGVSASGSRFQVIDPQATHVRLYATGDGAAVYFRYARNILSLGSGNGVSAAGLRFVDSANSEPPNAPFTSEIAQAFNVPPPIGNFLDQYQGRVIVYGVAGAPQSFFYTNIETTVVGNPPESSAPLNQVTMPIGDGKLFGSANLPTGFILWSNHQDMFKLTGLLSDNTVSNQFQLGATIQRLPYRIGCGSPYATSVTSLGAFWLSSDREVWLFTDHYAPKNVGKPIQDILNRINGARLGFAKMKNFKAGDRNWLALAVALDGSTFNNKLCILDLDLLASNGQASFFTFDMATNQPTWYLFDVNCESIDTAIDNLSTNHLLAGDVDLITDVDWQPASYTISAEQNITAPTVTLHALGNENPEVIKTMEWLRAMTNQLPSQFITQGWTFAVTSYDDDSTVIGVSGTTTSLVPGMQNPVGLRALEYSPALFRLGATRSVKGRRFQIQCNFPTTPGLYELRGFQCRYRNVVAR